MAAYNPRECGVCNELFDEDRRRPRTLPCSHHLCTECISQLIEEKAKQCPFCREEFKADSALDIMVNHGVEDFIKFSSFREPSYVEPTTYEPSAPELEDSEVQPFRKEAASTSRHLLVSLQTMQSYTEGSIQKVSRLKRDMQSENTLIEIELIPKVHTIMAETSEAILDLEDVHDRLVHQLKEQEEKGQDLRETMETVETASTAEEAETALERLKLSHAELQDWIDSWKNKSTDDDEVLQNAKKVHRSSKTKIAVAIKMLSTDDTKTKEDEEREAEVDSENNASSADIPKTLSGPMTIMSLQSLKPQVRMILESERVYAIQHTGGLTRTSRITLADDSVHLHYLQTRPVPPNGYTLDFNDVMKLMDVSSRLVFIELADDESIIGRTYIRLAPDTRRGQNFSLLCTGEMGPAYANTNLLSIFSRGQKRERVHGGLEMTLIKGLSWGGSYMRPWVAGTVGGMAEDNYGSRFNIYMKDYAEQMLDKAFGMVEQGLEIIEEAIDRHSDISKVKIVDCGLVIPRSPHGI